MKTSAPRPLAPTKQASAKSSSAKEPAGSSNEASSALERSLGYSLRRAQMSTFQDFSEAMDPFGIRPSHYALLALVQENPGLSQSAVSRILGVQKANLVTLLDGLEERGWTERRSVGGDRRASALYLTRAGETFVRKLQRAHDVMEAKLIKRLGAVRSARLLKLLHQFSAKARPAAD